MTDYTDWSKEDLEAEATRLAIERTAVRLEQNEVEAELDLRRAFATMSESSRRIVRIRLSGEVAPTSETSAEVKP